MKAVEPKAGYLSQSLSSASNSTYLIHRTNSSRAFHLGSASVLRAAHKCKVRARAEARSRTNVSQSVGPQPFGRVPPAVPARVRLSFHAGCG